LTATTESLDLTAISPSPLKANPVEIESKGSLKSAKAPAPVETLADKKPKSVSSQNKSSGTELSQDIKDLFSLQLKGALGVTATDNTRSENPASRPAVIYRPATKIAPTASQVTPKITMESVYSPSEKVLAPKLGSTIKKIFFIQK
jgi:hypothetical protein